WCNDKEIGPFAQFDVQHRIAALSESALVAAGPFILIENHDFGIAIRSGRIQTFRVKEVKRGMGCDNADVMSLPSQGGVQLWWLEHRNRAGDAEQHVSHDAAPCAGARSHPATDRRERIAPPVRSGRESDPGMPIRPNLRACW